MYDKSTAEKLNLFFGPVVGHFDFDKYIALFAIALFLIAVVSCFTLISAIAKVRGLSTSTTNKCTNDLTIGMIVTVFVICHHCVFYTKSTLANYLGALYFPLDVVGYVCAVYFVGRAFYTVLTAKFHEESSSHLAHASGSSLRVQSRSN